MKLSDRLQTIASLVPAGSLPADIGTDHAFLPIYLVSEGICPRALAMDVKEGPLSRAREHIAQAELTEVIETRLSDGIAALEPGEADTLILAGMGGDLSMRILEEGRDKLRSIPNLVFSPQSHVPQVRRYLHHLGYEITDEKLAEEDGKFYFAIQAKRGENRPVGYERAVEYLFGAPLLARKDPALRRYLEAETRRVGRIRESLCAEGEKEMTPQNRARLCEVIQYSEQIAEAYSSFSSEGASPSSSSASSAGF